MIESVSKYSTFYLELFQVTVQFETGTTGGKGGDEEIGFSIVRLVFYQVGIDHFHDLFAAHSDSVNIEKCVRYQPKECSGSCDRLSDFLV